MSAPDTAAWKHWLQQLSRNYSESAWRFPVLGFALLTAYLGPFFLLRGMRGVLLSAGLAFLAIAFSVCFANPFPTLLAALFLSFSSLDWNIPGPVSYGLLSIVLARVLFELLGNKRIDLGSGIFRASLAVLLAVSLTSLLFARRLDYAFVEGEMILQGLAYLICISYLADRPSRVLLLMQAVILGAALAIVLASKELVASGGLALLGTRYAPRVGATGWNANVGAMISICLLPFVAFLVSRARKTMQVFWLLISALLVGSVVLSASRMGVGVLAVVILLLTLRYRKLAILVIIACITLAVFLPPAYWTRFISIGQLGGIVIDESLRLRQHALEATLDLFRSHPWTGIGLGNVYAEMGRYMSSPKVAHNTYAGMLASLGIFGFLAYIFWFGSGIQMALRAWRLSGIGQRDAAKTLTWMILISMLALLMTFTALDLGFHQMVWLLLAFANAMRVIAEKGSTWNGENPGSTSDHSSLIPR